MVITFFKERILSPSIPQKGGGKDPHTGIECRYNPNLLGVKSDGFKEYCDISPQRDCNIKDKVKGSIFNEL